MKTCPGCGGLGYNASPRDERGNVRPRSLRVPCVEPGCSAVLDLFALVADLRCARSPGDCQPCCGTGYTAAAFALSSRNRRGRGDCQPCCGSGFTDPETARQWDDEAFDNLADLSEPP